ncbi:energy transducer TonB [Solilutibacter silvestris]|uniref:Protein TonB n=1 Tax=Solilutibacter silvestris TaxID=1645665 RepID=A0A2K1PYH0_9GAMM|nr:energy transducer TonB [Lysobacter silvestris]PNS07846.1 TonB protein [Lysobacter silvestris]
MPEFIQKIRASAAFQRLSAFARRGNTPWLLAALGVGFVLFLLMWGQTRKQFFTVEPVAKSEPGQEYTPLPTPTPGGSITDTPADSGAPSSGDQPRLLEPPKPPPAPKAPPPSDDSAIANAPTAAHGAGTTNGATSAAVPISQPAPNYPRTAMQMSREGRVRVKVEIDAEGVPTDSSLVESSGDRDLDRAALQSVRRWRFKPALAHGTPVASNATVPIEFKLSQ